jgi:hypothetical protein
MTSHSGPQELPDDRPLDDLLKRAFDEELTDDEFAALQVRLDSSSNDRRRYLEYASAHALLLQSFEAAKEAPTVSQVGGIAQLDRQARAGWNRRTTSKWVAAIVASIAVIAGGAAGLRTNLTQEQPAVARTKNESTGGLSKAFRPGDRVRTTEGRVDLRFENGVQLALSDGGELEILSAAKVRLHEGNIQVDVGQSGRGFTVLTRSADVVDLGTVFGVGVNSSGATDVVVFEGEVELDRGQERVAKAVSDRSLLTGEAVRVQADGNLARLPMIWRNSTDSQWSASAMNREASVIESVRDNLTTAERPKFYAVVPKGFQEDAKVYADRPYEWNGLDASGMPSELIGADYIRTFNSDKAQSDLEIVVALNGPADVYVLLDQRFPVPAWLAEDFTRTPFEVGIDLGNQYEKVSEPIPPLGISVKRWLGKGPGRSVDVPVTIWKRTVPSAGEVHFGPVPAESLPPGRGSMYGILAIPMRRSL